MWQTHGLIQKSLARGCEPDPPNGIPGAAEGAAPGTGPPYLPPPGSLAAPEESDTDQSY